MQNLPPRIISSIFTFAIPAYVYSDQHNSREVELRAIQKTLPLVCRDWHQVAFQTPILWTYIRLNLKSTPDGMTKKLFLSGDSLLDVRIGFDRADAKPPTGRFEIAYNVLIQTVDRWRSFAFDGIALHSEDVHSFIPVILPNVEEVGYFVNVNQEYEDPESTGAAGEGGGYTHPSSSSGSVAPKLQRFATSAPGCFRIAGCPSMQRYTITGYSSDSGDPDMTGRSWQERWEQHVRYLSDAFPNIKMLEIVLDANKGVDNDPVFTLGLREWVRRDWVTLPNLEFVRMEGVGPVTLVSFITSLSAPKLQEFKISRVHDALSDQIQEIMPSIPTSCRIQFENSPIHAIRLFLSRFRLIEKLRIAIEMHSALQLGDTPLQWRLPYKVPGSQEDQTWVEASDLKWIRRTVGSVDWTLREDLRSIPGLQVSLHAKILEAIALQPEAEKGGSNYPYSEAAI
ncbi:hypothetical protein FRB90_000329 [Tulasnella sp. 427]|nr:hypothetical protein FRB90_000329 [Tulasnella sp. 427]